MIEILIELEKNGAMKELLRRGIIPPKVKVYYDMFLEYDKLIKIKKLKTTDAVIVVCDKFGVSESTVYRSIKVFK